MLSVPRPIPNATPGRYLGSMRFSLTLVEPCEAATANLVSSIVYGLIECS